jgi:hypothetical protein
LPVVSHFGLLPKSRRCWFSDGWRAVFIIGGYDQVVPLPSEFITARHAAEVVHGALLLGNASSADRFISELASRILMAPPSIQVPEAVLEKPDSTGSHPYDVLLATVLAYAITKRGGTPRPWMTEIASLPSEWLWDGGYGGSDSFRAHIRKATPPMFRAKNLLLRERDLVAP